MKYYVTWALIDKSQTLKRIYVQAFFSYDVIIVIHNWYMTLFITGHILYRGLDLFEVLNFNYTNLKLSDVIKCAILHSSLVYNTCTSWQWKCESVWNKNVSCWMSH